MHLFSRRTLSAAVLALSLATQMTPLFALPVMEIHAEDLLPMAAELKKSLNLNGNQQTLWQQTESKTRQLLRERQSRREHLQAATKSATEGKSVELRDVNAAIDAETAASAAEEKQMREWWLVVNDALSESQRQIVVQLVGEQLQRVADSGAGRAGGEPHSRGEGEQKGGGRRKGGGGMGGMGGSGGGPGGASISLPGVGQ